MDVKGPKDLKRFLRQFLEKDYIGRWGNLDKSVSPKRNLSK